MDRPMHAAEKGHAACVDLLAEREGGMQDEDGYTALMSAVINNDLECAGLLAKREGHEDHSQMVWLPAWRNGPRRRQGKKSHCNCLHPQWLACSFLRVLSPVTLLVGLPLRLVHGQAPHTLACGPF